MICLAIAGTTLAKHLILNGSISKGQEPCWVRQHHVILQNRLNDCFFYPIFSSKQLSSARETTPKDSPTPPPVVLGSPIKRAHPYPIIIDSGCKLYLLEAHQGMHMSLSSGCVVISSLIAIHHLLRTGFDMMDAYYVDFMMKNEAVPALENLRSKDNPNYLIAMSDLLSEGSLFDTRLFQKMEKRAVNEKPYDKICHQMFDMSQVQEMKKIFKEIFSDTPPDMLVSVLFLVCDHQVALLRDEKMNVHIIDSLPSITIQGSQQHDGLYSTRVVCPNAEFAASFLNRKWKSKPHAVTYQRSSDTQKAMSHMIPDSLFQPILDMPNSTVTSRTAFLEQFFLVTTQKAKWGARCWR